MCSSLSGEWKKSDLLLHRTSCIDPTLEHDLNSYTKPWALSPLISTMPHFSHSRLRSALRSPSHNSSKFDLSDPLFPPKHSIKDDITQIHLNYSPNLSDGESTSDLSSSSSSSSPSSLFRDFKSEIKDKLKKRKRSYSANFLNLRTAQDRRSYFQSSKRRQDITFSADVRSHHFIRVYSGN